MRIQPVKAFYIAGKYVVRLKEPLKQVAIIDPKESGLFCMISEDGIYGETGELQGELEFYQDIVKSGIFDG